MKNYFEIVLKGFNGGTDETDHLIKWYEAFNKTQVIKYLRKNKIKFTQVEQLPFNYLHKEDIDLSLI